MQLWCLMTSKIVEFKRTPQPNAEAVEIMHTHTKRVESGEVVALALVLVEQDGTVATVFSNTDKYHALVSGVATLAYRLQQDE
jgi:hypothetical protein